MLWDVWGSRGKAPVLALALDIWVGSFMFPRGKSLWYTLKRNLCASQPVRAHWQMEESQVLPKILSCLTSPPACHRWFTACKWWHNTKRTRHGHTVCKIQNEDYCFLAMWCCDCRLLTVDTVSEELVLHSSRWNSTPSNLPNYMVSLCSRQFKCTVSETRCTPWHQSSQIHALRE
jgi:hypothetical protein